MAIKKLTPDKNDAKGAKAVSGTAARAAALKAAIKAQDQFIASLNGGGRWGAKSKLGKARKLR